MCTDFTSLNKACLNDFCLLPCLAKLVDGSAGHEVFDFMDASWGYHHIKINEKGPGAGILIRGPDYISMEYALGFTFPTTSNEAGYEAMVVGLAIVRSLGIKRVWVKRDSKLIMDQNVEADHLSRLDTTLYEELPQGVYVEIREVPTYEGTSAFLVLEEPGDWRSPITRYLVNGQLPESTIEARKIKNRSFIFYVYNDELYKKAWDCPLLSCVSQEDISKILAEVHQGWYGSHIGG
ncbi:hypothetical protein LIER_11019 [Lithospermum erythrorhizon]|uniref:RNase H type-1 domain-containing protein n=1 Tax=Lithospermum erythrorhizon TaxID=34254 RepID=A0AAV3PQI5_LITER